MGWIKVIACAVCRSIQSCEDAECVVVNKENVRVNDAVYVRIEGLGEEPQKAVVCKVRQHSVDVKVGVRTFKRIPHEDFEFRSVGSSECGLVWVCGVRSVARCSLSRLTAVCRLSRSPPACQGTHCCQAPERLPQRSRRRQREAARQDTEEAKLGVRCRVPVALLRTCRRDQHCQHVQVGYSGCLTGAVARTCRCCYCSCRCCRGCCCCCCCYRRCCRCCRCSLQPFHMCIPQVLRCPAGRRRAHDVRRILDRLQQAAPDVADRDGPRPQHVGELGRG